MAASNISMFVSCHMGISVDSNSMNSFTRSLAFSSICVPWSTTGGRTVIVCRRLYGCPVRRSGGGWLLPVCADVTAGVGGAVVGRLPVGGAVDVAAGVGLAVVGRRLLLLVGGGGGAPAFFFSTRTRSSAFL